MGKWSEGKWYWANFPHNTALPGKLMHLVNLRISSQPISASHHFCEISIELILHLEFEAKQIHIKMTALIKKHFKPWSWINKILQGTKVDDRITLIWYHAHSAHQYWHVHALSSPLLSCSVQTSPHHLRTPSFYVVLPNKEI